MIWLLDAVLAGGLAVAVALDELLRWRRRRALRRARLLEALTEEWPASDWLEDVTGSCEITMGPGVAIPYDPAVFDPALAAQLAASHRVHVPLGTHAHRPGAQLGDVLPDGRVVVATRGDEATLAWPAQIEGWQDVTPDNDAWAEG